MLDRKKRGGPMRHLFLRVGVCCGLVMALTAAGTALAQSEGQPPVPPVTGTEDKLEEIVVTAERRVSDIEKTPISITAVSGDALLRENAVKLDDAIASVAGVQIIGGPAGFLVRIRGEGINIPPTYGDPSVPVMLDGMYNTQVTTTFYGFYDVARVEVMRGPQGTLFGKNSTGGVVDIITNNPIQSEEGLASVTVGNYDTLNTQFMYNAPLTDDLAVRVAGSTASHQGFLSNEDGGLGSKSARLKLSYAPNQAFSLLLGVEVSSNDSTPPGSVIAFGTSCCSVNLPHGSTDPWYDPAPGGNYWRAQYRRYWADLEYDFGWAKLSVLPSVQTFDIEWHNNFAPGSSVAQYEASTGAYQVSSQNQYAGEIHLASPDNARVRWVAGVYYYNTPDWVTVGNNLVSDTGATQLPALYSTDPSYTYEDEKIRDIAGFAQATISLTDWLRLIAGARETSSRKSVYYVNNQAADTPGEGYLTPWNTSLSTTQFTYKAGLEEEVSGRSMLYQQVSTGFIAGGFNFNNDSTFKPETLTAFEIGSKNRLLQDTLQLNAEIFDNEIRDVQTYYQLQNPFLNGTTITAPVTVAQVEPARARSYGGELEMQYLFTAKDRLDFSASYLHARFIHFNDACLAYGGSNTSGPCAGVWPPIPGLTHVAYDGGPLPQSPTWTLTAAYQHTFTLPGGAGVTAHVDTRYFTRNYLVFDYKDPFPPFPTDASVVPAATVSNASLNYETANGRWTFEGWIHNMEGTPLKTGSFGPNLQLADPRTYGLSVWARF
jgi:iron complex outermembrane recepter protein